MPETRAALLRAAGEWADGELHGNVGHMAANLTNDFLAVGPRGFVLSKDQWLERHRSGALQYSSFSLDDAQVRVYDQAGVIVGRQTQDGNYQDQDIKGQFRVTLVFVKEAERWLLASLQLSPIMEAPGQPTTRLSS